ncbi:Uncharacterised protein [Mycobacteroides abscessus subsp. abscessus]|nr:Uncharacterised protein [Mycobacteroides abscessus subsp. abscessus]
MPWVFSETVSVAGPAAFIISDKAVRLLSRRTDSCEILVMAASNCVERESIFARSRLESLMRLPKA